MSAAHLAAQAPRPPFDGGEALGRIAGMLTSAYGLGFGEHNRADLERAVREAVARSRLGGASELAAAAAGAGGATVLGQLLESLTVCESYFFRFPEQFGFLQDVALPERIRLGRDRPLPTLRVWSAGCACGEEAYSLAIALRRAAAGLEGWRLAVLGTDVNPRYLERAAAARFSNWSLRGMDGAARAAAFVPADPGHWTVRDEIRALVCFRPLNLAGASYPLPAEGTSGLDVVFCRNVFIYFQPELAASIAQRLGQCLAPGGYAFFGPSDPLPAPLAGLEPVGPNCGLKIFRRPEATRAPPPPATPPPRPAAAPDRLPVPRPAATSALSPEGLRRQARACVDRGEHEQARRWAAAWLAEEPACAEAHFLLGLACSGLGRAGEAEARLRRALALEPGFALCGLALAELLGAQGRADEARACLAGALRHLEDVEDSSVLAGSDEVTAGWLRRVVAERLSRAQGAP